MNPSILLTVLQLFSVLLPLEVFGDGFLDPVVDLLSATVDWKGVFYILD